MNIIKYKDVEFSPVLNSWYISGIIDGEGCWTISISKNTNRTIGYIVSVSFEVALDTKDLNILKGMLAYFTVGNIYKHSKNMMRYKVSSVKDIITNIIPHFDKYNLLTDKRNDFELFKKVIYILGKGPLTEASLREVVSIKASINKGLSYNLKSSFANIVPSKRLYKYSPLETSLNPYWVLGFTEAEGNFYKGIYKKNVHKGYVRLVFTITQHIRDKELLKSLVNFFNCGNFSTRKGNLAGDFKVTSFPDIRDSIIPFFNEHTLTGYKSKSFHNFCLVADIIKENKHLKSQGMDEIESIINKEYS